MPHFFFLQEYKVIYLLPLLITPSPLFLRLYLTPCTSFPIFTLFPLFWPYSLKLYFILSLFYPLIFTLSPLSWPYSLNLYFTLSLFYPPIFTLSPLSWPYSLDLYFTLSLFYHPIFIILHVFPLLLDLRIFTLCSLNLSSLIGHQDPSQTLSLTVFEWKVVILLRHA